MGFGVSSINEPNLTSASGDAGVVSLTGNELPGMTTHQLTLVNVGNTASGTIPILFRAKGSDVDEVLYKADETTARVIDIASPETITFDGILDAVVLDLTGLTGTINAIVESR